ncbi:MAG: DUF2155 domain-containing protein [Pseudolabrys sp.]|jgi:hypothetical protein
MARFRLPATAITLLLGAAIGAVFGAAPAHAQFNQIFSDQPPRPPGSVPGQRQAPPPADLGRGGDVRSGVEVSRPREWRNPDLPPAQPLPAPMNLPPSSRPGAGAVQSQELAPPPGAPSPDLSPVTPVAPNAPSGEPQNNANTAPVPTLPGLPPGVRQPPGTPQQPADTTPQPGDQVVVEPPPQRIANPTAVFSGLDKITGRIISFDVAINETVQFGALQVTPRVCYSRPPTETPNTDAFVQVDEVTLTGEIKRIFSGWMFAASPGLHAVEHPTYDVWLTNCKGGADPNVADVADPQPAAQKKPTPSPPARPQRQPAPRAQQQPGTLLPPLR